MRYCAGMSELRIGISDRDRAAAAVRAAAELDERLAAIGWTATWVPYGDGKRTIDLLASEDLHVAATGAIPPLRAQSEGLDIAYLAACTAAATHARVVVRSGSTVDRLAALRGGRVALERGSTPTLALAELLERTGVVAYRDLEPVLLPAPIARRALLDGHVDAWLDHEATDPLGAALRELPGAAVAVADRTVWFARRDITVSAPGAIAALAQTLSGIAQPITRTFLAEQQRVADLLAGQGAIGLPVHVGAYAELEAA